LVPTACGAGHEWPAYHRNVATRHQVIASTSVLTFSKQ
jgi:hypothetical protein